MVQKVLSPYFKLIGRAQTINKSNYFGEYVVKACTIAAEKVRYSVLLNHSTDGVSCETGLNIHTIIKYLEGNRNHLSFTNTNQNVKKFCFQLVGGSCASVIGLYCFGFWIINMDGVEKHITQAEKFASDAVVLRLASTSTTKTLVSLDTDDIGNLIVTVILIVFMRL